MLPLVLPESAKPELQETVYSDNRSPAPTDPDLLEVEQEEDRFLLRVFLWMAIALLLSALGADWAADLSNHIAAIQGPFWPAWLLLAILMGVGTWVSNKVGIMPGTVAVASLLGFAFLNGTFFDLVFHNVTGQSFTPVYLSSAALFASMWIYGLVTQADPAAIKSMAVNGGLAALFSYFLNRQLHSAITMQWASIVVIVLFLVLFMQNLKFLRDLKFEFEDAPPEQKAASIGALLLYLDLVIIFVTILRIPWTLIQERTTSNPESEKYL